MLENRPNILILMPDQLRADSMGCAGHPQIRTPNMDLLASEGVWFSNAFTACPVCMPARASFVSGLYPHNHGIWTNAGQLPANDETLFHHLQDSGYYVAHVGKSHYYFEQKGTHMRDSEDYMHARGIDYVHESTGPLATMKTDSYMTDHWREKGLLQAFRDDYRERKKNGNKSVWPSPLPVDEFPDSYVGRKSVEFIDSYTEDKPFCLYVGFGGPHAPWDAPGEYATMYSLADTPAHIPPAEPGKWVTEHGVRRMNQGRVHDMTEEDIQKIRANYYGKISLIDHWFGEIFAALKRRGWWDNALVVFLSDHGEMAGDHLRLSKTVFYDSSVRVPLIIRCPSQINGGATSDAIAQNIDVYPTLLEAVEAEPSKRCFGKSLWPVLNDPGLGHREAAFSEISAGGYHSTMVCTDRYKYAMDHTGQGYMLHDMNDDPKEQNNLIGHPGFQEIEQECRDRILCFLLDTQCRTSREKKI